MWINTNSIFKKWNQTRPHHTNIEELVKDGMKLKFDIVVSCGLEFHKSSVDCFGIMSGTNI